MDRPPDPQAISRLPPNFDVEGERNHGSDGDEAQTPPADHSQYGPRDVDRTSSASSPDRRPTTGTTTTTTGSGEEDSSQRHHHRRSSSHPPISTNRHLATGPRQPVAAAARPSASSSSTTGAQCGAVLAVLPVSSASAASSEAVGVRAGDPLDYDDPPMRDQVRVMDQALEVGGRRRASAVVSSRVQSQDDVEGDGDDEPYGRAGVSSTWVQVDDDVSHRQFDACGRVTRSTLYLEGGVWTCEVV